MKEPAEDTMIFSSRSVGLVFALLILVSCGGEAGDTPFAPIPGTPYEIDATPSLRVGVPSGDTVQEFFRIRTPFLLPDGRLGVPLAASGDIRVFGPDGAFLETLGGSGEGPGEFVSLASAWPRGDTIEAFDSRLPRITRFLPDGSVQVVRLVATGDPEVGPAGALPNNWATLGIVGGTAGGRDEIAVHTYSLDGMDSREVARLEGMARISVPGFNGPHPLSPRAVVRVGSGKLYLADVLDPRIRIFGPEGTALGEVTWDAEALDPEVAMDSVRAAAARDSTSEGMLKPLLRTDIVPDRIPVFWDFMVDELGFIWILPFDPVKHSFVLGGVEGGGYVTGGSSRGGSWRVFSPEGIEVGAIEVPPGLRLSQITRTAVVAVGTDELGIESVRVHPLRRHQ